MNVKELVKALQKADNQDREVYVFDDGNLWEIEMVDLTIDDRVDLNVNFPSSKKTKEKEEKEQRRADKIDELMNNITTDESLGICRDLLEQHYIMDEDEE